MSDAPLISVVTVSFNHAEFLRKNIESVRAQDYPHVEHIVIDGGSTDETVEILKSYDHLDWISEPDRGQTHALNKGFRRAKGEIIAWLNSDDYYPPNIFGEIAREMQDSPVLMGSCAVTDRDGKLSELVPNTERNWYDLLRHWVYHFSPSQPSVFFRRELLEKVQYPNGDYLDEHLYYSMDLDLWLRIAQITPFSKRIDKTLSYFPKYEESKTGGDWEPVYREMGRLFRRYENQRVRAEHRFSVVLPAPAPSAELSQTLDSLMKQLYADMEVLVVGYGDDTDALSNLKKFVRDEGERYKKIAPRYVGSKSNGIYAALNAGIEAAAAPLLLFMPPGALPQTDLLFHATNLFQHDIVALALPGSEESQLAQALSRELQGARIFDLQKLLGQIYIPPVCVARKVALEELGGFFSWTPGFYGMKELLLRLSYKSWQVNVQNNLIFTGVPDLWEEERGLEGVFSTFVNALLIVNLSRERAGDPFAAVREEHGFGFQIPDQLVELSSALLSRAPAGWTSFDYCHDRSRLEGLVGEAPGFIPAWALLEAICRSAGDTSAADKAKAGFEEALKICSA